MKMKTNKALNVLIIAFLCFHLLNAMIMNSQTELAAETSFKEREESLSQFSTILRKKHLNDIGLIQTYLTTFSQFTENGRKSQINKELKAYFKTVETNIEDLNKSFKTNYEFCVNDLKKMLHQCSDSVDDLRRDIKFNKQYASSLMNLNDQYDFSIKSLYDMNILSVASNICGGDNDITEKNDVTELYSTISKHLDNNFHIFKTDEMEKILAQIDINTEVNTKKFLDDIVNKFNTEEQKDFMIKRQNMAQLLFNKVSSYLNASVTRKSKLLSQGQELFQEMKSNDQEVMNEIAKLKASKRGNIELAYSLNKENELNIKHMRNCENVNSLNHKCEETSKLFKSILNSYRNQAESIQSLYKLVTQN